MTMSAHVPEPELLLAGERELPPQRQAEVEAHLEVCSVCRARQRELEREMERFSAVYRSSGDAVRAPARPRRTWPAWVAAGGAAAAMVASMALVSLRPHAPLPDPSLTPGATRSANAQAVCAAPEESPPVRAETAREVFARYGIRNPKPRAYEVDFLITPALGGSDDVQNLWPQPYAEGEWNSRVKDALEDHLRALVCAGRLELAAAQTEIARDWIAAYRRHFRTERPLAGHFSFVKDQPWE